LCRLTGGKAEAAVAADRGATGLANDQRPDVAEIRAPVVPDAHAHAGDGAPSYVDDDAPVFGGLPHVGHGVGEHAPQGRQTGWTGGRKALDSRRKSRDATVRGVYGLGAMDREERNVLRIIDGDEQSLARRVDLALSGLPDGSRVDHFTYWYTGRPPLHEATVSPPVEGGAQQ
jgi:hypothetical protein